MSTQIVALYLDGEIITRGDQPGVAVLCIAGKYLPATDVTGRGDWRLVTALRAGVSEHPRSVVAYDDQSAAWDYLTCLMGEGGPQDPGDNASAGASEGKDEHGQWERVPGGGLHYRANEPATEEDDVDHDE